MAADSGTIPNFAPLVLCLMGPTGTGKSALALELAEQVPAEIVSVDSAMIYRGMDIGTDKPAAFVLEKTPHHLIDICDPSERYNAARFATDAALAIEDIHARGRLPILAGGTFLYFRSLIQGLSPMPGADPEVRENIQAEAEEWGWEALHAELEAIDPATAARIAPTDTQRLERALELVRLTGRAPSELHAASNAGAVYDFLRIALWPSDRDALYAKLADRFELMMEQGLLEEVIALRARGDLDESYPAVRAVGYRQLWHYLAGDCSLEQAMERAVTATRRYAKRQLTWLRGEQDVTRIEPGNAVADTVIEALKARLEAASEQSRRVKISAQ